VNNLRVGYGRQHGVPVLVMEGHAICDGCDSCYTHQFVIPISRVLEDMGTFK